MDFSGERFVPEIHGNIALEHLHRYSVASSLVVGKSVLDIASGEGYGSAMLARKAKKVIGVDVSIEAVQFARKRYHLENLEFKVGNCTEIPIADACVDIVVSFETIEHLDQHEKMLQEVKRVLRPDGLIIISSPDKYYYSVEPGYHNPFHKKELFEHEFKDLLNKYFKVCIYYQQRITFGSTMSAEIQKTHSTSYFFENSVIIEGQGLLKPLHWIGLASDSQLPELPSSIFEQSIDESQTVKSWRGIAIDRDHQIQNLVSQLTEKDLTIKNIEGQLTDQIHASETLHTLSTEREERISELQQQLDKCVSNFELLQNQLTEKERLVENLGKQITNIAQQNNGLQTHIDQREQILQNLNSTMLEIYSSTAWKVIRGMWKVRLWLAPKGSWQEKFAYTSLSLLRRIRKKNKESEKTLIREVQTPQIENAHILAKPESDVREYDDFRHSWRKLQVNRFLAYVHNNYAGNANINHIILLPLLSTGGAELVAANFTREILQNSPSDRVLFIVTDLNIVDQDFELPPNAIFLNLIEFLETNETVKKKLFIYDLIKTIKPSVIHNINSSIMWQLIIERGYEICQYAKIYANIFCFQFNVDGTKTGYAEYYLRDAIPYLDGLISDNNRFIHDAIHEYGLQSFSNKFHVIYTPARSISEDDLHAVQIKLSSYSQKVGSEKRLKCIWAGRLDAQKRWDLFLSIVKTCEFCDFDMYGKSVVDDDIRIPDLPNLNYRGTFTSSRDVFLENDYDVFVFTSVWEGLPTILLDAGIYGVPIIAPTVGGVRELVTHETGFPLSEQATVEDYVAVLMDIKRKPEIPAARAENMQNMIMEKHNWGQFSKDVYALDGYLHKNEGESL